MYTFVSKAPENQNPEAGQISFQVLKRRGPDWRILQAGAIWQPLVILSGCDFRYTGVPDIYLAISGNKLGGNYATLDIGQAGVHSSCAGIAQRPL